VCQSYWASRHSTHDTAQQITFCTRWKDDPSISATCNTFLATDFDYCLNYDVAELPQACITYWNSNKVSMDSETLTLFCRRFKTIPTVSLKCSTIMPAIL
jgi:hypothetical protein